VNTFVFCLFFVVSIFVIKFIAISKRRQSYVKHCSWCGPKYGQSEPNSNALKPRTFFKPKTKTKTKAKTFHVASNIFQRI